MKKPKTNIKLVTEMMEYSQHGALAQMFVIAAIDVYSRQVIAGPLLDPDSFVNPEKWKEVAEDIQRQLRDRNK